MSFNQVCSLVSDFFYSFFTFVKLDFDCLICGDDLDGVEKIIGSCFCIRSKGGVRKIRGLGF